MDRLPPFDKIGALPVPDFQNADPANSNPGSIVNALIFNQLQREGVNLELLAGLTPDSGNLFQWTQAVSRGGIWVDELTGTGDLAVATLDAVLPAFLRGMRIGAIATAPNTGATPKLRVMNLGSTGAYVDFPIVKEDGSALAAGDIKAGRRYRFEADGAGNVAITGAGVGVLPAGAVVAATAAVTLYVDSTSGDDTNGDGSQSKPFKTNAKALSYASSRFSFGGYGLIIQAVTVGDYDLPGAISGVPNVTFVGNPSNPSAYRWRGTGTGQAQITVAGCNAILSGGTLYNTNPAINTIGAVAGGVLKLTNCGLGGVSALSGTHVLAGSGGTVTLEGTISVTQSAGSILDAESGNITSFATIAVPSSGSFSTALVVANGAGGQVAFGTGAAWSGTTTGQRFAVSLNAVINSFGRGLSWIPGSVAGTQTLGGLYA
ncbi:hypothetical protein ACN9MF_20175 [Methylobacterium fujisawaense]|uniref:hypothetical protein n=1 Tax=Methylobacterium fujisawaense TaxID=107400 RepID=UPI003CF09780